MLKLQKNSAEIKIQSKLHCKAQLGLSRKFIFRRWKYKKSFSSGA